MISIIISSSNPDYLSAITKNIEATVGVPYEILATANGGGKQGICTVYNAAGAKAKYDVLCFMHEDMIIHTQNWGKKVVEVMKDPKIGLLGIAGSKYKSLFPCGWSCPAIPISQVKANFIQRFKFVQEDKKHFRYNTDAEAISEVATVDGVWMCTKRSIFDRIKFDEEVFTGFHGYDLDYSLQINKEFKVCVTFDMLIEHFSEGNYSPDWMDSILKLHRKHRDTLPVIIGEIPEPTRRFAEKCAGKELLKQMRAMRYSMYDRLATMWRYDLSRVIGLKQFLLFQINILIKRY